MKNILKLLWISVIEVSCSPSPEQAPKILEGSSVETSQVNYFPTLATSQSRTAVERFVRTGALSGLDRNWRNEIAQKTLELPALRLANSRTRSADERQVFRQAYKGFTEKYGSDTILVSTFRDQYAMNFLTVHELKGDGDTADFIFYTNELIESHMGNYELITNCMENLKGKVDGIVFERMRQNVEKQMRQSALNEGKLKIAIPDMVRQKEVALRKFESESMKGNRNAPKRVMLSVMGNYDNSHRDKILQLCMSRIRRL